MPQWNTMGQHRHIIFLLSPRDSRSDKSAESDTR